MKFEVLLDQVRKLPCFDLATVVQLGDEPRQGILNQLSRFVRAGKLIALRRGMYALAEPYRQVRAQPAELAAAIYRPSYLSTEWALSYYGVLPEGATVLTSVTTRSPRRFVNALGEFSYRHVKPAMFFGYAPVALSGRRVLLASPEKALLDYWHLHPGEWTLARLLEARLVCGPNLSLAQLEALVARVAKPRLSRAFERFARLSRDQGDGEVEL